MRLEKSVSLFCQFLIFPRHLQSMHQQWKSCKRASKHTLDRASNIKHNFIRSTDPCRKLIPGSYPNIDRCDIRFWNCWQGDKLDQFQNDFVQSAAKQSDYQNANMEHFLKPNWIAITTRVTIPKLNLIIVVCS